MLITLLVILVAAVDSLPERCSVGALRNNPEGYFWPLESIRGFVESADVIVRVRADRVAGNPDTPPNARRPADLSFVVVEVLRGESPAELRIGGYFVEQDDFNRGAVPYRMVRPSGQRGSCLTQEYRRGAEYLLLLRNAPPAVPISAELNDLRLNPYWAPLAPLNEQVRGADDPWVVWVKSVAHEPSDVSTVRWQLPR